MATKNLIPRGDGEGGIGKSSAAWGEAHFKTGHFYEALTVSGVPVSTGSSAGSFEGGSFNFGSTDVSNNTNVVNFNQGENVRMYINEDGDVNVNESLNVSEGATVEGGFNVSGDSYFSGNTTITETFTVADGKETILGGNTTIRETFTVADGKETILGGNVTIKGASTFSGHMLPATSEDFDIGSAEKKVRNLFLSSNSLWLGDHHIISEGGKMVLSSGVQFGQGGATLDSDGEGRLKTSNAGLLVGQAEVKPDPNDPTSLYFAKTPQVQDSEGNPTTILTADKLGLGTSAVLDDIQDDLKFKLLTDQERFVVGTTGEGNLASGWYRFNDFKVKGATDVGAHPINPVDTRIYSDESSFILFKTDTAGNRVAHLVGGNEAVTPNNAIALGIAVKVDQAEYPEDIEFVHTDGESYSVINGNSDSLGTNGLPIRQGFQAPSLGSNPSPLLIDGGSF